MCAESRAAFWQDKGTRFGSYGIWRCQSCGSGFVWPRPDAGELAAHYASPAYGLPTLGEASSYDEGYYPTSWGDAETIINRCAGLANGRGFLDIGAGNGAFSHVAAKYGFEVDALEPSQNARAVFREVNGFNPHDRLFDHAFAGQMRVSYDVVLMSQVLEHMLDPLDAVRNIHTVLRPGGIAAIAVPHFGSLVSRLQGTNDMFISPPEHLNFFSKGGLTRLFAMNGFKLRLIETVSKAPRRRIERLARLRLLGAAGWRAFYAAMWLSNQFSMGTVLNAYFQMSEK